MTQSYDNNDCTFYVLYNDKQYTEIFYSNATKQLICKNDTETDIYKIKIELVEYET